MSLRNLHLNDVGGYATAIAAASHATLNLQPDTFYAVRQRNPKYISIPAWFGAIPESFKFPLTARSMGPFPGFEWPGISPLQFLTLQIGNSQCKARRPHEQVGHAQRHTCMVIDCDIAVEPHVCMSAMGSNSTEMNCDVRAFCAAQNRRCQQEPDQQPYHSNSSPGPNMRSWGPFLY